MPRLATIVAEGLRYQPDAAPSVEWHEGLRSSPSTERPRADGKFFFVGTEKLYLRGVTYGTFAGAAPGDGGYVPATTERDFELMASCGINAVRLYTVPPRWLLDMAHQHGLWVLAGIPWQQHVTFLDSRRSRRGIEQLVRGGARALAGHPAILGLVVGNEIPAQIVRWHGARRVETFIDRLCEIAREADPRALVTYVSYPSTEYLQLAQLDFMAHNVYIEDADRFADYVGYLQTLADNLPLVIAEVGLDSRRHGEESQALLLDQQVRATFERGAAGAFVFAWTDEWTRTGVEVRDWDFGLTSRDRRPKRALSAVGGAFLDVPFAEQSAWPPISVVVCSYNGGRTITQCLDALTTLAYPDYEVIVIDDGSTDDTAAIASRYDVRLIRTSNEGLSAARNEGLRAATGEIVAYIDDDAWPDRDWLTYLARAYETTCHVAIGGPNVPPRGQTRLQEIVARAPGGANHVLRSDSEAEHIPGCNCSFRVEALRAIGGFDTTFCIAGDDVDVCWRLRERGWTLGFAPGAVVWHRRRGSVGAYLRQQRGYGEAEALLERKWPNLFNALGHISWPGQLYGGRNGGLWPVARPFHGTWGAAEFQSLYQQAAGWMALPLMPEWFIAILVLAVAGTLGVAWPPMLMAWPVLALMAAVSVVFGVSAARRAGAIRRQGGPALGMADTVILGALYLAQPVARLLGRVRRGLTPWRRRGPTIYSLPLPRRLQLWSEDWQSLEARLRAIESRLRQAGVPCMRGGPFDRWDLEVRAGTLACVRILSTSEEHGSGKQLLRFRMWPRIDPLNVAAPTILALLAAAAWAADAVVVSTLLSLVAGATAIRILADAARSMGIVRAELRP